MYVDSNDEMFFDDETDRINQGGGDASNNLPTDGMSKSNREMYTKLMLKTTDEERKRIKEQLKRNKKRSIELFL